MEAEQIVLQAAGRAFQPNMLYDAVVEQVVGGVRLWDDCNVEIRLVPSTPPTTTEIKTTFEDSSKSRFQLLGITGPLKLSFMSGLVPLSGAAKYLKAERSSLTKDRIAVLCRCVTRIKELTVPNRMGGYDHPEVFSEPTILATHLVTGVKYGGTAVFLFEWEKSAAASGEDYCGVGTLGSEACLELIQRLSAEGVAGSELSGEEKNSVSQVSCSYFGDFNLTRVPQTFLEAWEVMTNIPQYVGSCPVEVTMVPLSRMDARASRVVREVSAVLKDEIESYLHDLDEVLFSNELLKASSPCTNLRGICTQLDDFQRSVSHHRRSFVEKLAVLVPKIRSTGGGEEELSRFVAKFGRPQNSPFCSERLASWVKNRGNELEVIWIWLKEFERLGATVALNRRELMVKLRTASRATLLIIYIPSCADSQFLKILNKHWQAQKRKEVLGSTMETSEEIKDKSWCDPDCMKAIESDFNQILTFFDRNRKTLHGRVFVTELYCDPPVKEFRIEMKLLESATGNMRAFEVPSPPQWLAVARCSSKGVEIRWQNSKGSQDSGVTGYRVECCNLGKAIAAQGMMTEDQLKCIWWDDDDEYGIQSSDIRLEPSDENYATACVMNLLPSTRYAIRIQAVTPLGNSTFSSLVCAQTQPALCCAIRVRDNFAKEMEKKPNQKFPGKIFELQKTKMQHRKRFTAQDRNIPSVDSFEIGESSVGGLLLPQKVLLVVGETGSGKTTLLDGIANAYYQVKFEDDFRLKLVNEETVGGTEAASQTQTITVYTLHPVHGKGEESSSLDFPLVLIDTPGFGDTRGRKQDKLIAQQINKLLGGDMMDAQGLVSILHGIGFVVKASQNRLTETQEYVFDQVLSLFGNDMEQIFMPLITFCDEPEPQALSALKARNIPGDYTHFHVNNAMLYADNRWADDIDQSQMNRQQKMKRSWQLRLTSIQWAAAELAYASLFGALQERSEGVTLQLTRAVLRNRQQMELATKAAFRRMEDVQKKLRELLGCIDGVRSLDRSIFQAAFTMKQVVEVPYVEKVTLKSGKYATSCQACERTCHEVCTLPSNALMWFCKAINWMGRCVVCPGKCPVSKHVTDKFVFQVTNILQEITDKDLYEKYEIDLKDKEANKKVVSKMLAEFARIRARMALDILTIHKCLQALNEIALRRCPLTDVVEYIDLLIYKEKQCQSSGWEGRVQELQDARKCVEIMARAREGRDPLDVGLELTVMEEIKSEDFDELADEITRAESQGWSSDEIQVKVKAATGQRIVEVVTKVLSKGIAPSEPRNPAGAFPTSGQARAASGYSEMTGCRDPTISPEGPTNL